MVTRIDDGLAAEVDRLVDEGTVESRSDAVRQGLRLMIDRARRQRTAKAITDGYALIPQTEDELGWIDRATVGMINEEPWD